MSDERNHYKNRLQPPANPALASHAFISHGETIAASKSTLVTGHNTGVFNTLFKHGCQPRPLLLPPRLPFIELTIARRQLPSPLHIVVSRGNVPPASGLRTISSRRGGDRGGGLQPAARLFYRYLPAAANNPTVDDDEYDDNDDDDDEKEIRQSCVQCSIHAIDSASSSHPLFTNANVINPLLCVYSPENSSRHPRPCFLFRTI